MSRQSLALVGFILVAVGFVMYSTGVLLAIPRRFFFDSPEFLKFNEFLVWYSGVPILIGFLLILIDLFILYPNKRINEFIMHNDIADKSMTVCLTAYNDESSIGLAVRDFLSHPMVERVIVVSNNSSDSTLKVAEDAGAIVFNENIQGYGACVFRALSESVKFDDTALTALCEGDMTFRAYDLDKLLSYIPHADIVNGTRTVEQLRAKETQLSIFMFYGNLFVGKILEIKHLGNATFTDVGTTYKLLRNHKLRNLLPTLNNKINLEFNPYFLDMALSSGLRVLEAPITFHKRVGESKGGNIDNYVALRLGLKMIKGLVFGWDKR